MASTKANKRTPLCPPPIAPSPPTFLEPQLVPSLFREAVGGGGTEAGELPSLSLSLDILSRVLRTEKRTELDLR